MLQSRGKRFLSKNYSFVRHSLLFGIFKIIEQKVSYVLQIKNSFFSHWFFLQFFEPNFLWFLHFKLDFSIYNLKFFARPKMNKFSDFQGKYRFSFFIFYFLAFSCLLVNFYLETNWQEHERNMFVSLSCIFLFSNLVKNSTIEGFLR